ncbi:hypothetical protein PENSPDRAFT_539007, partial [Peniophora sp. CONT]
WSECSDINVFPHGDASEPPALNGVLQNVIEKSNRTVVVHGLGDFILIAEGTRVVLQNMTGHMIPQFSPVAALQIMSFLMGFRDT